ncbi:colanic acid biosynthesis protein [Escherichia phage BF17]|nr:colanic acid biosynthesis protein [Escherichia phage BF17]
MAVFSNLEGTMMPTFKLGKRGASINFVNDSVAIKDFLGETFLPVKVGTPNDDDSAVNVRYLEDNPNALFGVLPPTNDIGKNNNTYFQVDSEGIVDIFAKTNDVWVKSLYINKNVLSSVNGADYIGLITGGTLQQAQFYITPEEFGAKGDGITDDTAAVNACAVYAKEHQIQIQAGGNYRIRTAVYLNDIQWFGGTITGNGGTMVSVLNSTIQQATLTGCYLKFFGGNGKFYFNKFINITSTAAFLMQGMTESGTIDFCFNEMTQCKYGVLQQGTGEKMTVGRYSYNHIHDIYGDAIELNVVNSHYPDGFVIEGNLIENVDGTDAPIPLSNWGIGIGVAGSGPYDVNADDSQYVKKFVIKNNRLYNVRQCIHVELGKDFKILNNEVYPSTLVSIGTGLTTAGVITYGSVDFIIDGLSGHLLNDPSVTNRMVSINWGVTSGKFAGPPRNFKLCNLHIPESSIIVHTSGSDNWLNTTELSNITCSRIQWRGLPSSSKFNNISTKELDVIGQHLATEGEGGGLYTRSKYTYTNWTNCVVQDDCNISKYSFSRMYVDRIDQSSNNFKVTTAIDGTGHRGPVVIPVVEQYYVPYDVFPGGRYFPEGTIIHKQSGGKFIVTVGGSFFGRYDTIRQTVAGQTYIEALGVSWGENQYAKAAGTEILITGAGENGEDLKTYITRAVYVVNNAYRIDIADPIVTATAAGALLKAAQPITYITLS